MYHSSEEAIQAEEEFDKIFINKGIPDDIGELIIESTDVEIVDLIIQAHFANSRGEARRLVTQGGVSIDGEKITDPKIIITINNESILKVGKRKFIKLVK